MPLQTKNQITLNDRKVTMNNVISRTLKASLLLSVLASSMTHSATKPASSSMTESLMATLTSDTAYSAAKAFAVGMGLGAAAEATLGNKKYGIVTGLSQTYGVLTVVGSGEVILLVGETAKDALTDALTLDDVPTTSWKEKVVVNTAGIAGVYAGAMLVAKMKSPPTI